MSELNEVIKSVRKDYTRHTLSKDTVHQNPFAQFEAWMQDALEADPDHANAMTLCTVGKDMMPDARVVLLRNVSHGGFTFYTNYQSKKGQDLAYNSKATLLFFWQSLERQVRIAGNVVHVPASDSDQYFASRPFESKAGAWASQQSTVVQSRAELEKAHAEQVKRFEGQDVPRPAHWGGYVLIPTQMEFWQGRPSRLHDRIRYSRNHTDKNWIIERLMP